jgi:subtilisin family serine protease
MKFPRHFPPVGIKAAALAALVIAAQATAATSASAAGAQEFAPARILIGARAGLSGTALAGLLAVHGGKARKIGQSDLYVVDLALRGLEKAVVEKLAHHPQLTFAELDLRVKSALVPNDPYYGSQWHLPKIKAASAWNTTQGAGVTIAILDSGIDSRHPDLAANLVPGYNLVDNNADTSDVCGHGTAVAGTAAALSNNGAGVAGIAGQSSIMPLRIAFFDSAQNGCYAYYSTIASGLTYAADHGARVANVSYGGVAGSAAIQNAAQYMKGKGGLVFVSAGNNGIEENIAPGTAMIAVSATDSNDVITSWSSYGSFVALSAPGAGIWTTSSGAAYQSWNGTSFSSPLSAGVAALMMAANQTLDAVQIENMLFSTAVDLGASGRDNRYGYGRVDAAAGVLAAASAAGAPDRQAPTASISAPLANSTVSGLVAVDAVASDNVGVARVELKANGTIVALDSAAPYRFSWDSTGVPNGMATLVATAYDAAGNSTASTAVSVNVVNSSVPVLIDITPPLVAITNPVAGSVSGNVAVSVSASDNSGAAGISQQLYIDGVLKATGKGATLGYNWNTRTIASGTHTLTAVARDKAGNASSSSVQVRK